MGASNRPGSVHAPRPAAIPGRQGQGGGRGKFRDHFDAQELAGSAPSHRVLAIFRGEQEGALSVQVRPGKEEIVGGLTQHTVTVLDVDLDRKRIALSMVSA